LRRPVEALQACQLPKPPQAAFTLMFWCWPSPRWLEPAHEVLPPHEAPPQEREPVRVRQRSPLL